MDRSNIYQLEIKYSAAILINYFTTLLRFAWAASSAWSTGLRLGGSRGGGGLGRTTALLRADCDSLLGGRSSLLQKEHTGGG